MSLHSLVCTLTVTHHFVVGDAVHVRHNAPVFSIKREHMGVKKL